MTGRPGMPGTTPSAKPSAKLRRQDARNQRLADALRENLHRRKAQARAKEAPQRPGLPDGGEPPA